MVCALRICIPLSNVESMYIPAEVKGSEHMHTTRAYIEYADAYNTDQ